MIKLMVVEGNARDRREETMAQSGTTTGESYAEVLRGLAPGIETEIVYPVDADWSGLGGKALRDFDGAVITGSGLHMEGMEPMVKRQVDFVREALLGGVPFFGSCWGMQVLVTCAGGVVKANSRGRELGVGRNLKLTREGESHLMYEGKEKTFDVVSVHMDHVVSLPSGATVLASNEMSEVQALEIEGMGATCWGVQYHPEFDLAYMANILDAFSQQYVENRHFTDLETVSKVAEHMRAVTKDTTRKDLKVLYGWNDDVTEPVHRLRELSNWLEKVVKPRHTKRI